MVKHYCDICKNEINLKDLFYKGSMPIFKTVTNTETRIINGVETNNDIVETKLDVEEKELCEECTSRIAKILENGWDK